MPHIPASPQNNILHALSSGTTPLGQDRSCCKTFLASFLGHQKVLYIAVSHPISLRQDTRVPALMHPLLIPREIWNTKDSVVAQIGSGGSFHEFCTSVCLSLYEAQQHRPAPQSADASDTSRCSVCHKPGEVSKSLVLPMSWMKCLGLAALSLGQDQGICQVFLWSEASALSCLGLTPKLFFALRLTASYHSALPVAPLTFGKGGYPESTPASSMALSRVLVPVIPRAVLVVVQLHWKEACSGLGSKSSDVSADPARGEQWERGSPHLQ